MSGPDSGALYRADLIFVDKALVLCVSCHLGKLLLSTPGHFVLNLISGAAAYHPPSSVDQGFSLG